MWQPVIYYTQQQLLSQCSWKTLWLLRWLQGTIRAPAGGTRVAAGITIGAPARAVIGLGVKPGPEKVIVRVRRAAGVERTLGLGRKPKLSANLMDNTVRPPPIQAGRIRKIMGKHSTHNNLRRLLMPQ